MMCLSAFLPSAQVPLHHPRRRRPSPRRPKIQCESETPNGTAYDRLFLKGPVPGDRLLRTISASGEVSCRAISASGLVCGAARLHSTSPVATTAFGRALLGALLLSSGKKDGETLQVEFRGSGPLRGLTTIGNGSGEVRGYIGNPNVHLPFVAGQLDVPGAIGSGILAIVRNSPYAKRPYTGMVQISSGEVAEDLAHYLLESEQIPSALAAGVSLAPDGSVTAAGGYLMQLLPGASSRTAEIVERNVRDVGSPTEHIQNGRPLDEVVEKLMFGLEPMKVASVSPRYCCPCGIDRVKRTISVLPEQEVRQLLEEHGNIEGM